jgi:hypothetical protein
MVVMTVLLISLRIYTVLYLLDYDLRYLGVPSHKARRTGKLAEMPESKSTWKLAVLTRPVACR